MHISLTFDGLCSGWQLSISEVVAASELARAFPNLDHLEITMHDSDGPGLPSNDMASMIHDANKADLCLSGNSLPLLKYLKADPHDLYLSAFMPKAEVYMVTSAFLPDDENEFILSKILPSIRPSVLQLTVSFYPFEMNHWPWLTRFFSLMPTISSLKKLELNLHCNHGTDVEHIIVRPPCILICQRFDHTEI